MTLAKHRFCLQIAALMGCLGLQPSRAADLPTSKHFTLVEMADGVWAAIAKPGGWSICNIGIIDLGKDVVLFDAGMNRHAAAELSATAEKLTGRPVTTVVLSHGPSDHVRGAIGLPTGLTIIATPQIVEDILADEKDSKTDAADSERKARVYAVLDEWESALSPPGQARFWHGYLESTVDGSRDYVARRPNKLLEGTSMTLAGPRRKVILKALSGHTRSDVIAVLPEDRIVFAGDLLFAGHHPFFGDSPGSGHLLDALDALEAEGARRYVPGHGPISGPEAIQSMRRYVQDLRRVGGGGETPGPHGGVARSEGDSRPVRDLVVRTVLSAQHPVPVPGGRAAPHSLEGPPVALRLWPDRERSRTALEAFAAGVQGLGPRRS
ncbi:MAG TPA: MBL fold metallo-hydrolase [Anaeromyxobacter sp.]|nr:MBL fold metallo-hydrolase [Anaeromyxobacter sp.]